MDPDLSLVPEPRAPPNGCWPTTAPERGDERVRVSDRNEKEEKEAEAHQCTCRCCGKKEKGRNVSDASKRRREGAGSELTCSWRRERKEDQWSGQVRVERETSGKQAHKFPAEFLSFC